MKTSYKKGVLVWIDDNFLEHDFLKENSEIDKWQAIFGTFSKKIYRLLDLELKIMTNKEDFENYLAGIEQTLDTYYYFIVDLSLPESIGGEPEVINGLEIGETLKNKNHDFCFLSSSSSAGSEMHEMGLGSYDYYVKFDNNDLLPESLRHKILFSFRNNISWIELLSLRNFLDQKSTILLPKESHNLTTKEVTMAISLFPYFDKFRDFLDRTEYESNIFNKPFFIRSHPDNSYEFECQALLIMLADRIFTNPGKILIEYDNFTNLNFRLKIENSSDNIFWAIKLEKNIKINEFEEFYKKIKRKQVVFIINDNEAAEKFLERVNYEHTTLKDLPYIKQNDSDLRDEIISKSIQLFLNYFYKTDNRVNNLYLEHPALLIHPKNMMFLSNPYLMTSNLTDSPEILSSLFSGFKEFFANTKNKNKKHAIANGTPIPSSCMFRVSDDILSHKDNQLTHDKALILALDNWLKVSWKYPYGYELEHKNWKQYSFDILLMLITEFNHNKSRIETAIKNEEQSPKEEKQYTVLNPHINALNLISELLNSNAIKKVLAGEKDTISLSEWEDLAYLRWPHLKYPMPMYLNELLEQSDKHLWIQHKNFNFVGYSKKLILENRKLNNMLAYYDKTISLMKRTHHYFPQEMQGMFEFILNGVEKKKDYTQETLKDELFTPLTNFMDEFLVISLLFRSTYGSKNRNTNSEIKKIKDSIKVTGNYGKDIGIIDGSLKKEKPFLMKAMQYKEEEQLVHSFRTRLKTYISKGYFKEDHFLEDIDSILATNDAKSAVEVANALLHSDILQPIEKDPHWKALNFQEQVELIQNSSIVDHIRQIFSQFEYFNLHFNIIKNIDSSTLLQYLASIRNKVIAHQDATEDKNVDLEYLYESFIYSYEAMLLQYQYLLSQLEAPSEDTKEFLNFKTNYTMLREDGQIHHKIFKVRLTNQKSDIKLDEVFSAEIQSLYCENVSISKDMFTIEGITLKNLDKLSAQFHIDKVDIHILDLLDINKFVSYASYCEEEPSKCIKLNINKEWLK